MKTFENTDYRDDNGDIIAIECCDTHVEIMTCHATGCWVSVNPNTLREMAAQLIRGAEQLEIGK